MQKNEDASALVLGHAAIEKAKSTAAIQAMHISAYSFHDSYQIDLIVSKDRRRIAADYMYTWYTVD
jgi:hypothetical protein